MQQEKTLISLYMLLKICIIYVCLTMLLHYFGPWEYSNEKALTAIVYMIFVIFLFSAGFISVAKKYEGHVIKNETVSQANFNKFSYISKLGLVIQTALIFLIFFSDLSNGNVSLNNILNPGQTYISALERSKEGLDTSLLVQIKTLLSPIFYLSNAQLLFNYFKFSRRWRYGVVSVLVLQLFFNAITKGTQKGVFDLLILFASVGFLRTYFDKDNFLRWIRFTTIFLGLAVVIFVVFQLSRMTAYNALDYSGAHGMWLARDGILFKIFGDSLGLALSLFIMYLSQGYYGLSLCLQLPFVWTYGAGNSFAITSYVEQYFGILGINEATYPARMELQFGFPAKMYWHTFFPWVASDLTFPGAAVLMFFIGKIYARSFIDSVIYENPLGICIFYFITTLILFLPANNQLMQTREMMIGFLSLLIAWLVFGNVFRTSRSFRVAW